MPRSSVRFWILAGLLAANLVAGVLSLYFIRSVNQRYADLFEHGAPVIYDLRMLTRELTGVQRLARRLTSPEDERDWPALASEMEVAHDRLLARAGEVGAKTIFENTGYPSAMQAISAEYAEKSRQFLRLTRDNRPAEAMHFNLAELRPCHDRFQETLDGAANHIEAGSRDLRDRYRKDSRFFGGISLASASAPLVALSLGLLVMTAMIGLLFLVLVNPRADRRA